MTTCPRTPHPAAADEPELRGLCGGAVHLRGDAGYDAARTPWNAAVDQRPAAVVYPASPAEVAAVVRAARRAGLRVAPQGTGHNARPLGALGDVVLLRTAAMHRVTVDAGARTARVEAGVLWQDAVEAAAEHGLAALHGSSPDVGVVGYSLGGGVGWYARKLGLQANSVTAVELVTADGDLVRADATHETDLFWALRGGGGSFGVVTALEFSLYDVARPVAGLLAWKGADAPRVLARWTQWALDAPDEVTSVLRILQVPAIARTPGPQPPATRMPMELRGRTVVVVDGAVLGDAAEADRVLAPLRELGPELDTFAPAPPLSLTRLHLDPEGPTACVSGSTLLGALPPAGADALLQVAGPDSGSSMLVTAELRQRARAAATRRRGDGHPGRSVRLLLRRRRRRRADRSARRRRRPAHPGRAGPVERRAVPQPRRGAGRRRHRLPARRLGPAALRPRRQWTLPV